jgi:hypothetical protein
MSDYLWDKSGEPDAEVERLEGLLGALRHSGVAPELPSGLEARASTRAGIFSHEGLLRPARLAAAAALLLVALAGALVMLRSPTKEGGRAASNAPRVTSPRADSTRDTRPADAAPEQERAPEVAVSPSNLPAAPESSPGERERAGAGVGATASAGAQAQRREPPRELAAQGRARDVFKAAAARKGTEATTAVARGEGFDGGAPDLESRVRAKEQLVYALRLTSEALREVRGRASGADARANAFDGRSPLR